MQQLKSKSRLFVSALMAGSVSAVGLVTSPAEAAITQWGFSFNNYWTEPVGGSFVTPNAPFAGGEPTSFSWGAAVGNPTVPASPQSALTIDELSGTINTFFGPTSAVPPLAFENTQNVTHDNFVIADGSGITSGTLVSELTLTPLAPPSEITPPIGPLGAIFTYGFKETLNNATGPSGSADDIFVLTNINIGGNDLGNPIDLVPSGQGVIVLPLPSPPFPNHDGELYSYLLELGADNSLRVLTGGECLEATGSSDPCIGFTTQENMENIVPFNSAIQIEKAAPEPGTTAALFGVGAAAFTFLRKRKESN